jgi:hypothetical protein
VVIPLGLFLEFVRAPAYLLIGVWAALQVVFAHIGPSFGMVAWWAHIGGFVFGVVYGVYVRRHRAPPAQAPRILTPGSAGRWPAPRSPAGSCRACPTPSLIWIYPSAMTPKGSLATDHQGVVVGVEQQRSAAIQHHEILEERQLCKGISSLACRVQIGHGNAHSSDATRHFTVHFRQQFGQAGKASLLSYWIV